MRAKSLALLLLALGCGLVASIGITRVMANRHSEPAAPSGETETIFVAMKDVGLGDILTSQLLRLEPWPKDRVPAGVLTRIEDVEGRRSRTRLYAGEPILESKLFRKGSKDEGPDALIPKGYRVVTVKVDAVSGTADMLMPGSRVDVMVSLTANEQKGIQETTTRIILQDIKVFAVNDVVSLDAKDQGSGKSVQAKTISLLVTPEQAAKVTLASEMGKIRLVMRSPEDDQQTEGAEAKSHELFGRSESGNRDKETLLDAPPADSAPGAAKSFLDLLNTARAKATPQPRAAVPEARTIWTVRILKPGLIDDVVLEAEGNPTDPWQGFGLWKSQGTGNAHGPAAKKKPEPKDNESEPAKPKPDAPATQREPTAQQTPE